MTAWDAMFTRDEQLDWLKSEIIARHGRARWRLMLGNGIVQAADRDEPGRVLSAGSIMELADLIVPEA